MLRKITLALSVVVAMSGCSKTVEVIEKDIDAPILISKGKWIVTEADDVMYDPQTSGLINIDGVLVSISDGSAAQEQQRKLHIIDKDSAKLLASTQLFSMSNRVRRSCFSDYLTQSPDFEALANDPRDPSIIYVVTEDATRTGTLSERCEKAYENTGSTDYPTLLVRLKRDEENNVSMTHVRPLQFPKSMDVGNFPNDGIEGLAMASDGTLYLGLEKDKEGQPRIFSLQISEGFWDTTDFAVVAEPELSLPHFSAGNHPINGLALYEPSDDALFILAAARNDNELWVIDTQGKVTTKRIPLQFNVESTQQCDEYVMDNASIEGLVVDNNTLWLINDPWKVNYLKNIQCDMDAPYYEAMAPLLFSLPLNSDWFIN